MTLSAVPPGRQFALAPLDEKVDHVRGSPAGRLIIEYGDYECPYSRQAFHAIELVEQQPGGTCGSRSGISRCLAFTRTPSPRRPRLRPPRGRAGSGTCASCSSTGRRRSRTATVTRPG